MGFELCQMGHVCVHRGQVHKELLWCKVKSFRVLDFKLEAFLGSQLVETEIHCLSELLAKFVRDERLLAVGCDSGQERYDHIRKMERTLCFTACIHEVAFCLVTLFLWQLVPGLLILSQLLVILYFFKSQQSIEEQTVHVIDKQVAEFTKVSWIHLGQLRELRTVLSV